MLGRLIKEWQRARRARTADLAPASGRKSAPDDALDALLRTLLREGGRPPAQYDYEQLAYLLAAASSAQYMTERMMTARNLVQRLGLLDFALDQATVDGLVLEFGVYTGATLQRIAARWPGAVHGFDSFEGLPEDWTHFQKKGRFSLRGQVPEIAAPNVVLHKGWFADTLPGFLVANPGPVRFAHVDCDLYSAAKAVLDHIEPRLVPESVIVFDEYLNYPGWERHEHLAFREMVADRGRRYEYLGFASTGSSVAVRITG